MSIIPNTIFTYLPNKKKLTPSGWYSFNAVCCNDTRNRGGYIVNDQESITYHCFHCGFKASWQPGRQLSINMKKLLHMLNVPDSLITKLSFEAIKLLNEFNDNTQVNIIPTFINKSLPPDAEPINTIASIPNELVPTLQYIQNRSLFLEDYNFHWSPKMPDRLIIPFYFQNKLVGYTARDVTNTNKKYRYISEQQPGYVFNLDAQHDDRKFVIVCEGPIDAISINGCALLGSDLKEQQISLIQQLHKTIVLVPDKDKAGQKLVKQALDNNWAVAMPDYPENVKDINDCIMKIGRLATLFLIVNSIQSNKLKIQLKEKQWFK